MLFVRLISLENDQHNSNLFIVYGGREAIGGPFIGDGYGYGGYGGYGVVSHSIHPATAGPVIPHMATPAVAPISRSYISPYATPIGPPVAAPVAAAPVAAAPVAPVVRYCQYSSILDSYHNVLNRNYCMLC